MFETGFSNSLASEYKAYTTCPAQEDLLLSVDPSPKTHHPCPLNRGTLNQPLELLVPGLLTKKRQPLNHTLTFLAETALLFYLNHRETKPIKKFAHWDCKASNAIGHVENVEPSLAK